MLTELHPSRSASQSRVPARAVIRSASGQLAVRLASFLDLAVSAIVGQLRTSCPGRAGQRDLVEARESVASDWFVRRRIPHQHQTLDALSVSVGHAEIVPSFHSGQRDQTAKTSSAASDGRSTRGRALRGLAGDLDRMYKRCLWILDRRH